MKFETKNLNKNYGKNVALNNISLTLKNGIIGILAPNGAGKTTLLRILATISAPNSGNIYFNGKDIFEMGKGYRDIIGYLPQDFGVYPNQTAEKFLRYFSVLKGISKEKIDYKIDEILDIVSLSHVKKKKLKTFSGGMKKRIGIAQALLNDPKILILDEPTASLDPDERIKFRDFLITISKSRLVILSTHIVSDLEAAATDIVFMREGQVISHISPEEALSELEGKVYEVLTSLEMVPKLKKKYIVSHSMNKKSGIAVRILGDKPEEKSTMVEPNLEDVYTYYYQIKS
ncbi:ABC transporter ATP-binding protein [Clostridium drakei]|uniref:ABC transporter ATP-binding protein n=1 Tax=Clostridium drakei TaxID=332101 RepID=A0A2U8DSA2_9CLOT|nr:ABC transporter ATP-binding protein [Clostridium drakei]AWI05627.1 ABC transporter ATP-binding protein [Clostridium drakei]